MTFVFIFQDILNVIKDLYAFNLYWGNEAWVLIILHVYMIVIF